MAEARIRLLSTSGITSPSPVLADGVWLNLGEGPYFDQDRLGSTDLCKLFLKKEGWWWQSRLNPAHDNKRQPVLDFGKALHKAVLEGSAAFNASIYVMPDKKTLRAQHGDNFCITIPDMVVQLEARGMHPKANQSKDWFMQYCKQRAPDLVLWDIVAAEATKAAKGKILLTAGEKRDIELMARIVHNHADIGELFQFSPTNRPMPEVTVLYTDEHGLRRRVRFDELLPQNLIDLKTIGNPGNKKLEFHAGEHVARFAYHVQMADHLLARRWMLRFIQAGKIFDGQPEDLRTQESGNRFLDQVAWLKRFPTEAPNSDYAWIFYQRPDATAGDAPIVFPWGEDLGGELHMRGIRCRRQALETYRRCMAQFGPDEPWMRVEPLHTSGEAAAAGRRVHLVPWIGGDEHIPGEEEDL